VRVRGTCGQRGRALLRSEANGACGSRPIRKPVTSWHLRSVIHGTVNKKVNTAIRRLRGRERGSERGSRNAGAPKRNTRRRARTRGEGEGGDREAAEGEGGGENAAAAAPAPPSGDAALGTPGGCTWRPRRRRPRMGVVPHLRAWRDADVPDRGRGAGHTRVDRW